MNFLDFKSMPVAISFLSFDSVNYDICLSPQQLAFDIESMRLGVNGWIMHYLPLEMAISENQQTAVLDITVKSGYMPERIFNAEVRCCKERKISKEIQDEAKKVSEEIMLHVLRDVTFSEEFRNQ